MDKPIYLDNAATTPTDPAVVEAMLPWFSAGYGNPSAIYSLGAQAKEAVTLARETVAGTLNAQPREIYFTAGGTEADNWALIAAAQAYAGKGRHIITSAVEHHAVLHTCQYLEKQGFSVTYVGVDDQGVVRLDELRAALRPDTILISVMFANNEIGTLQPIAQIGQIAREAGVLFHTDAVQAYGHLPIDVKTLGVDLLSASGHKLRGPKGVGFLYVREGVKLPSFLHGGAQERARRAGTENVPGVVGLGEAAKLAQASMARRAEAERELRDYLIGRVEREIPYCRLNGHRTQRLPGNVNFSFRFIEGESMLILLDQAGICASSGSACTSSSLDPSHVLLAIGLPHEIAHGSLRLTLSAENTREELDYVVDRLKEIVQRLRQMSPLYEDFCREQERS